MTSAYLWVFVVAVVVSFILTRTIRNIANARGWVYAPASSRHIHKDLIPRLGGIAVFAAFAIVAIGLVAMPNLPGVEVFLSRRTVVYLLVAGTLVFLLGLYDDFRPVKPQIKFVVQAIGGAILYFGGFRVFQVPLLFGSNALGWLELPLTIMWVLWITNAFNLLDGIDGLAAGSALFSTLTVFVISLVSGNFLISALTLALAGAVLGFLRFNFNPATIFLGDCGSLFIGFMLSALALAGTQKTPTLVAVAIPVISFGLPVLETVLSLLRRFLSGQPLFEADRQHIHHKLLERGFSQQQVVIILYVVSAICGLLSLFLLYPSGPMVGIVLFVIGTGIWIGVQHLGYHEFVELGRVALRTMEQKKIIVNNVAIRRATEALSKTDDLNGIAQILREAFEVNDFDGLELSLAPGAPAYFLRGDKIASEFKWGKRNGPIDLDNEPSDGGSQAAEVGDAAWKLSLDLKNKSGARLGGFSLFRTRHGAPLLVDVNLLISGFNVALSGAVERAFDAAARGAKAAEDAVIDHSLMGILPDGTEA
jgi:UDP-GlcNAc:undecaprenyl-phosphate/decaprenyl-phosphate GlcNAc-1-phosphate transferase